MIISNQQAKINTADTAKKTKAGGNDGEVRDHVELGCTIKTPDIYGPEIKNNIDKVHPEGERLYGGTLTGDIRIHRNFHSTILNNDRDILVYLPPGYSKDNGKKYPVLYVQDGQNVFNRETACGGVEWGIDEAAEKLIREGRTKEFIIVAIPNNSERMSEYTNQTDFNYGGGKGDKYESFVMDELRPYMNNTYSISKDPDDTNILGSSLGADISISTKFHLWGRKIDDKAIGELKHDITGKEKSEALDSLKNKTFTEAELKVRLENLSFNDQEIKEIINHAEAVSMIAGLAPMSGALWFANKYIIREMTKLTGPKQPTRMWLDMGTNEVKNWFALESGTAFKISEKALESLTDKLPDGKLDYVKTMENERFSEKELSDYLLKQNFDKKEIDMVMNYSDKTGIDTLKDKLSPDKLRSLEPLLRENLAKHDGKPSKDEVIEYLGNCGFSGEEINTVMNGITWNNDENHNDLPDTLDNTRELGEILLNKGYEPGKELFYHEEPGGTHNEWSWNQRIERVLLYLFGK